LSDKFRHAALPVCCLWLSHRSSRLPTMPAQLAHAAFAAPALLTSKRGSTCIAPTSASATSALRRTTQARGPSAVVASTTPFPPRPRPSNPSGDGGGSGGPGSFNSSRPKPSSPYGGGEQRSTGAPGSYGIDRSGGGSRPGGGYQGRSDRPAYSSDRSGGQTRGPPRAPRAPLPPGATTYTECGKCRAAYEMAPAELGPSGRKVVCCVCNNAWFQRPDSLRGLRDGSAFKDYPLEQKDSIMAQREERRNSSPGGPRTERQPYTPRPGQGERRLYSERQDAGERRDFTPRDGGYQGRSEGGYQGRSDGGYQGRSDGGYQGRSEGGYQGRSEGGYQGRSEDSARQDGGYQGRPAGGSRAGNGRHSVFIGNISFNVTSEMLEKVLSQTGDVERVSLVTDPMGRSKGFAFADMKSEEAVNIAVDKLNGHEMDGRQLTVRVGRKKE
jgi:predicted Zn finger-like uncharacterized protein